MEQKLLRSQMNPHFLFNVLNAIQGFIFKSDPVQAGTYLGKFAELIRMILDNSRSNYVTLDKEILSLEHYLELQKLRFTPSFDYIINVDDSLNQKEINVPPMLAQPFIENAIEKGIKGMEKGLIEINFYKKKNQILFDITDNGVGLNKSLALKSEESNDHRSLATTITKERIHLIKNEFNQAIRFNIVDLSSTSKEADSTGTKVSFQIPLVQA